MQRRYLAVAALGCGAVWYATGSAGTTPTTLEFTRPALPAPQSLDLRPGTSAVHVSLPVDIGPLAGHVEQTLPEKLVAVRDILSDAACGKRNQGVDCNDARLEGSVTRTGPVDLQLEANAFKLGFPVHYDLTATGLGWAAHLTEHKTGDTRITLTFVVSPDPGTGLDVSFRDDPALADSQIQLLRSHLKLSRLLDGRLKAAIKTAEDDLRRSIAALPVKTAMSKAWGLLASPVELGQGSGLWFTGSPEHIASGELVTKGDRLYYRLPIVGRMAVTEAEQGRTSATRRQMIIAQETPAPRMSSVRMALPIDLEAIRQIAEATFNSRETFEGRADRFSEPVKVKVHATRVYPAMRLIGLELDVDVTTHKGTTFAGKLNIAGRPVLDTATGTVTLADVTFPPVSTRDASVRDAGYVQTGAKGTPRLGTEPFASKFAAVAKLDVSRAMAEALPRAALMLNQQVGQDLALSAHFTSVTPVSIEMARDSAWLLVDLVGDVEIMYDGIAAVVHPPIAEAAVAPGEGKPTAVAALAAVAATPKSKAQSSTEAKQVQAHQPQAKQAQARKAPDPRHEVRREAKHEVKHETKRPADSKPKVARSVWPGDRT